MPLPLLALPAAAAIGAAGMASRGSGRAHFVPIPDDLEGGIDDRAMPPAKGEAVEQRDAGDTA